MGTRRTGGRVGGVVGGSHGFHPRDLTAYLAGLTVTQGRRAGEALDVLPWEADFVAGAFAEGVQSAALTVARGNGKSTLVGGLAAAAIDGPLAVPRGEVVVVASSLQQSRIVYEHALAFLGDRIADRKRFRVLDSAQLAMVEDRSTGARVRCIGSDPRRAHGLAPT